MRTEPHSPPAALAVFGMLVLAACARPEPPPPPAVESRPVEARTERVGDGLTMVPVAVDRQGCVEYRLHSGREPALRRSFYRTASGVFTTDAREAACP